MTPFKKYMGALYALIIVLCFLTWRFSGVYYVLMWVHWEIFKHQRVAFEVGFVSQLASAHLSVMVQVWHDLIMHGLTKFSNFENHFWLQPHPIHFQVFDHVCFSGPYSPHAGVRMWRQLSRGRSRTGRCALPRLRVIGVSCSDLKWHHASMTVALVGC